MTGAAGTNLDFPYTFDQVLDALAATKGEGTHFVLVAYLAVHEHQVGAERLRRALATPHLRGPDANTLHLALARVDPEHAHHLVDALVSARSMNTQQELLANLPDVISASPHPESATKMAIWLRRRVRRPSYLEYGASLEIPAAVLVVLRTSDHRTARDLLAGLDVDLLSDGDMQRIGQVLADADEAFAQHLLDWYRADVVGAREFTPEEIAESDARWDREAARAMRRLGFKASP